MTGATRARWSALAALGIAASGLVAGALFLTGGGSEDEVVAGGPVRIRDDRARAPTLRLVDRDDLDGDGIDDAIDPDVGRARDPASGAGDDEGRRDDAAGDPAGRRRAAAGSGTSRPYDLQLEAIELPEANPALTAQAAGAPIRTITGADLPADVLAAATGAGAGSDIAFAIVPGTPSANPKPAPTGPVAMSAGLPKDIIRRVIRRSMPAIRDCYERALVSQPRLAGTVVVAFEIGLDGAVASAEGSGMDPTVATCVAGVIARVQFPRPDGGGAVRVRYPFVFRAAA